MSTIDQTVAAMSEREVRDLLVSIAVAHRMPKPEQNIRRHLRAWFGDEPGDVEPAKCPNCDKRGGLIARQDAFVNHPIPADGNVDWQDHTDVSTYDHTQFECTHCNAEPSQTEINEANNFEMA